MKTATLHNWTRGRYTIWGIAYGKNPAGPRGGACGNVVDGRMLITRCGVGSFGVNPPQWMERAVEQLNETQPTSPILCHKYGTSKFEIIETDTDTK